MSGTDRTVMPAGHLLDIVDDEWRADTLPEDGALPSRVATSDGTDIPRRSRTFPPLSTPSVLLALTREALARPSQTSSSPRASRPPRTIPRSPPAWTRTPPRSGPSSACRTSDDDDVTRASAKASGEEETFCSPEMADGAGDDGAIKNKRVPKAHATERALQPRCTSHS